MVGAFIGNVYSLFKPFYQPTGKGYNQGRAVSEKGRYPLPLVNDIAAFFREEFPKCLGDLTVQDVIARIQHGKKRNFRRHIHPPDGQEIAEL